MVPIFQMRKLRLKDLIMMTQLKSWGRKVQAQETSPHVVCFCSALSMEGELALTGYAEAREGGGTSPAISRTAHLTLIWVPSCWENSVFCFQSFLFFLWVYGYRIWHQLKLFVVELNSPKIDPCWAGAISTLIFTPVMSDLELYWAEPSSAAPSPPGYSAASPLRVVTKGTTVTSIHQG